MNTSNTKQAGFSLIEVALVIVVLAVLGVVGYLAYTNLMAPEPTPSPSPSPTVSDDPLSPTHEPVPPTDEQMDRLRQTSNSY